jgi:Glycosyltransferase family 87
VIALWLLLLVPASVYFCVRGPIRAARSTTFNDFISPYIQTNAWLRGLDPYSPPVAARLWPRDAGIPPFLGPESEDGTLPARRGIPSPYPPTALPLLVPLALMPWPTAIGLWIALNVMAFVAIVLSALALVRVAPRSAEAAAIVVCALVLAPFHTAIAVGNIVLIVFALGMLSCVCLERHFAVTAGMFLAAASALKPTIVLPFLIYLAARRQWRTLVVAFGAGCALFLLADLRMLFAGVRWVSSYVLNSQRMFAPGSIDDFTFANRTRFDLLNLQLVFFQILGDRTMAQAVSWLLSLGLLVRWAFIRVKSKGTEAGVFDLAVLTAICLLPFYHRFYDSCLLFLSVVWAIPQVSTDLRALARTILVLLVPFMVPGAALLQYYAGSNARVGGLARSWWWQLLVAPHQVWIILAVAILLLAARTTRVQTGTQNRTFLPREGSADGPVRPLFSQGACTEMKRIVA